MSNLVLYIPALFIRYYSTLAVVVLPVVMKYRGGDINDAASVLLALSVGKIVAGTVVRFRDIRTKYTLAVACSIQALAVIGASVTAGTLVPAMFMFFGGVAFTVYRPLAKASVPASGQQSVVRTQGAVTLVTAVGTSIACCLAEVLAGKLRHFVDPTWILPAVSVFAVAPAVLLLSLTRVLFSSSKHQLQRSIPSPSVASLSAQAFGVLVVWALGMAVYQIWLVGVASSLLSSASTPNAARTALVIQPLAFAIGGVVSSYVVASLTLPWRRAWLLLCGSTVVHGGGTWLSVGCAPSLLVINIVVFGGLVAAVAQPAATYLLFYGSTPDESVRRTVFLRQGLAADLGEMFGFALLAVPSVYFEMEQMAIPLMIVVGFYAAFRRTAAE